MKCAGLWGNPSSCSAEPIAPLLTPVERQVQKWQKPAQTSTICRHRNIKNNFKNTKAPVSRGGSFTGRILISKRKRWRIVSAKGRSNPSGPLISISKTKLSTISSFPLCRYRSLLAFKCSRVKTRLKVDKCDSKLQAIVLLSVKLLRLWSNELKLCKSWTLFSQFELIFHCFEPV